MTPRAREQERNVSPPFPQHLQRILASAFPLGQVVFYFRSRLVLEVTILLSSPKALCVEQEGISMTSFKPGVGKEWTDFKRKIYGSLAHFFPFSTNLASRHGHLACLQMLFVQMLFVF